MGATFQYLLYLYWIFTTAEANVTWTDDCEEQLLIGGRGKLIQFCSETNATQIIAKGFFWKVLHSQRDGGTIVGIQSRWGELVTYKHTNSRNATWTPHALMDLQSQPRPCDDEDFAMFYDVAIDSVSGILYVTYYECGQIRAFDLKRSLFSTVYEDLYGDVRYIATASRQGFLLWTDDSGTIFRALLDGTEMEVLAHNTVFVENLAVDPATSLVYWTDGGSTTYQSDLQGNNKKEFDISISGRHALGKFTVRENIMFWFLQEISSGTRELYRAEFGKPEKRLVYSGTVNTVAILPTGDDNFNNTIENACENSYCSHICVRSNRTVGYTCLCPDDYKLERDGYNCDLLRRQLLVSTKMEGVWHIPILNGTTLEPTLVVNTSSATDVQCDPARRKMFWAEGNRRVTKILQLDMESLEQAPKVVFEHLLTIRVTHEELGAFAIDIKTGNLYMAFNGERRILVCGRDNESTNYTKCAELFGNKLGLTISGLALDPSNGTMYWAQPDEEDPSVIRGGMDGSWMETLKKGGQPKGPAIGAHSRVYWLNPGARTPQRLQYFKPHPFASHGSFQLFKYTSYAPERITIGSRNLFWAGLSKDSNGSSETIFKANLNREGGLKDQDNIEKYVDKEFTNVTGLWMCDAGFERKKNYSTCGIGRQCAGLCLPNGTGSFRCVCPMGSSHGANGSSCKEIEEPAVIYSAVTLDSRGEEILNGSIRMKNAMKESLIYEGPVYSMAFDPVRRELFWCNYVGSDGSFAVNGTFRLMLKKKGDESKTTAPQPSPIQFKGLLYQLEYDWIGENLYFVSQLNLIGLCSTATGECTIMLDEGSTIALDPSNGRMYWCNKKHGIWRGDMDASGGTLIVPKAETEFLTVDHTFKLLFWLRTDIISSQTQVFYSDLDGKNVKQKIRLYVHGLLIRVNGGRLWMKFLSHDYKTRGILSCDKETGDNLKMSEIRQHEDVWDFIIVTPAGEIQTSRDICNRGALCSHMCIPTPSGYMRCLCPTGYKLMEDGWTCECHDANVCNASNSNKLPPPPRPSPTYANSEETTQVVCKGNEFSCVGKCLGIDKLCNGVPDCKDFSDEGEGCEETCNQPSGCLHNCSRSPRGPLCFCPSHQGLDVDKKGCVVVRVRTETVGLIVGGVVGLVLVIVIVLVTLKYRRTKRERDLMQGELDEFMLGDPAAASVAPDGVDRALFLPFTKVILPEDIIIARDTKLGSGEFGVVHPGICHSEPVAIKVLKHSVDVDEFKAVLAEVKIMAYLGDHEFIVKFVGAEISEVSKRRIMIVTELSPKGDLLKYLWKVASVGLETPPGMRANVAGNPSGVTNMMLYAWCEQIATGMEYLAQKQIVHGDLAARNVLVFKDNVVKIADFGLSKQLYGCSTYQMKRERKLPWKWSAIELLTCREFSEASDVWAFGVTAWEIFTLGRTPYKGIMIGNEFIQYIQAGNRLPKPEHASQEIFQVLLECWDSEPRNRPNFQRLKEIFHNFVDQQRGCMQPVMNTMGSEYVTAV